MKKLLSSNKLKAKHFAFTLLYHSVNEAEQSLIYKQYNFILPSKVITKHKISILTVTLQKPVKKVKQ